MDMRLAASHEVVGRICGQAPPVDDPIDQLHGQLAHYIAKGFTPEAAAQLAQRQPTTPRHQ
jgi:hypothetical protein